MAGDPDVVVAGGGIAGLVCALRLARAGARVLVCEQNHQVGGLAASITRRGLHFEVGDQSVVDGGILFPLLGSLGVLDDRWRRVRFRLRAEGAGVDLVARELPQVEETLAAAHPASARGLAEAFAVHRRVSALLRRVAETGAPHVRGDGTLFEHARFAAAIARDGLLLRALLREPFGDLYRRLLPDSPVRDVLCELGYPRMSALLASAFWHFWCHDYFHPRGGMQRFFEHLVGTLEALAGEVRLKTAVESVLVRDGRARGVRLEDGTEVAAKAVVLALDLPQALSRLLPGHPAAARVAAARPSEPLLTAYVGLSWPRETLAARMGEAHLFHLPPGARGLPGPEADGHRRCFVQLAAPTAFDEQLAAAECSAIVVQAFTDPSWGDRFGQGAGPDLPRTKAYREGKRRLGAQLVEALDRALPGAAAAVTFVDVGTPLSGERFTRSPGGASAGFSYFFPEAPREALGRFRTHVKGAFTCGHTTVWPGSVPTAALSGKAAADLLLRDGLLG